MLQVLVFDCSLCADAECRTLWDILEDKLVISPEEQQRILNYKVDDRDSWLRTIDFTESNAFGRSFACRRCPHCSC